MKNMLLRFVVAVGVVAGWTVQGAFVGPSTWDNPNTHRLYQLLGFADPSQVQVPSAAYLDGKQIELDQVWSMSAGSLLGTILIEVAGNANRNAFGVYDVDDPDNKLEVFSGPDAPSATREVQIGGSTVAVGNQTLNLTAGQFGFYLSGPGGVFYSQASLNPGGYDQMVTFGRSQVPNYVGPGWIIAFEDLPYANSDQDFNDFVISLAPVVPEPGTMLAAALLLLPFGLWLVRTADGRGWFGPRITRMSADSLDRG